LGVKLNTGLAVKIEVSSDTATRSCEAEEGQRHWNWQIDANLSHVDVVLELPRMETVVGENGRAVAVRVGVDEVDGIVQRIHIGSAEHRTYGEDEF
jgi:hypothetical protein